MLNPQRLPGMEPTKRASHAEEFRLVLSPNRGAGSRARQAVRQRFSVLPEATRRDLVAVVTELVNNSVEHGPGKPITLTVVPGPDSIRGEVADQGNPAVAIPQIKNAADRGRGGLALVDELTSKWAVHQGSTHVWFEVPLDTQG
jgi:anti-sigma regulatory factor (Ser/Thr protein kinase)